MLCLEASDPPSLACLLKVVPNFLHFIGCVGEEQDSSVLPVLLGSARRIDRDLLAHARGLAELRQERTAGAPPRAPRMAPWAPERLHTGAGVRRYAAPPPPVVPDELLHPPPPDPILENRAPHAAVLGNLDLSGIPPTLAPDPIARHDDRHPLRPRMVAVPPLAADPSSMGWYEINKTLGESREQLFLGNNLRERWTQAQIFRSSPSRSSSMSSLLSMTDLRAAGRGGPGPVWSGYAPGHYYRTSSDAIGRFAQVPRLPNTTGPLRHPAASQSPPWRLRTE